MAIGNIFSKLFGAKDPGMDPDLNPVQNIANATLDEKIAFRTKVIQAVQDLGGESNFVVDENDPLLLQIYLNDQQNGYMDLNNGFNHMRAYQEDDDDESIQRVARILISNEKDTDAVTEDDIVVVLRPEEYVKAVSEQSGDFIAEPFCGELYRFYMVDTPDALRALTTPDVPDMSPQVLKETALNNVRKGLDMLESDASLEGTILYYVEGNTFLTSSLVLLDEFWEHVERTYSEEYVFALPRKDQLFVFDANDPEFMDRARHMIRITFEDDFNLLTPQIFRRENGQIILIG